MFGWKNQVIKKQKELIEALYRNLEAKDGLVEAKNRLIVALESKAYAFEELNKALERKSAALETLIDEKNKIIVVLKQELGMIDDVMKGGGL